MTSFFACLQKLDYHHNLALLASEYLNSKEVSTMYILLFFSKICAILLLQFNTAIQFLRIGQQYLFLLAWPIRRYYTSILQNDDSIDQYILPRTTAVAIFEC